MTKRCSLIFMKFQHCCRYGQLCCPNVERPFDFVVIVYGAKATRSTLSTFNKVDRVEFNFFCQCALLFKPVGLHTGDYRALVCPSVTHMGCVVKQRIFTTRVSNRLIFIIVPDNCLMLCILVRHCIYSSIWYRF